MLKVTKKQQKENLKNAIDALNEMAKVKLAPSSVHGVGVFAMRDIKKGEKLTPDNIPSLFDIPYEVLKKKVRPEIVKEVLGQYPLVTTGSHFLYPTTRFISYMNHSIDANYDSKGDIVLRDIEAGEEIFEDYTKIDNYEVAFPWLAK